MSMIMFTGRAGQEPEIRRTAGGKAVLAISIADSRSWFDKQTEERKEATEWHRVVMYGDYAERLAGRLKKGDLVEVIGELRYRTYKGKHQEDVRTAEIFPTKFKILQHTQNDSTGVELPTFNGDNANNSDSFDEPYDDDIPF